jgi:hypothetical protein
MDFTHVVQRVKLTYTLNWDNLFILWWLSTSEHEVVCGSKPAGTKRGEGEIAIERQPPQASGREAATSSRGSRLRVVEIRT